MPPPAKRYVTHEEFQPVKEGLERLTDFMHETHERFDKMDERFEKVDARFDKMDARFDKMDARFDKVDAHLARADGRADALEAAVTENAKRTDSLELRMGAGFAELKKLIEDNHAALISMIRQLVSRREGDA